MTSKCLTMFTFAIALAIFASVSLQVKATEEDEVDVKTNHLIVGTVMPGDQLTVTERVYKEHQTLQWINTTRSFRVPRRHTITMVQAVDQATNNWGARATVVRGGPGFRDVTIRFRSRLNGDINFIVNVFSTKL